MEYDNTTFFNTYVRILRNRFENTMNDCMNLETQVFLAKEKIEELNREIEQLKKNINKLEKSTSSKKAAED